MEISTEHSKEKKLDGKIIAILAADGFEQSELFTPRDVLIEAGAEVIIVSPKDGLIKSWTKNDWGEAIKIDMSLEEAEASEFDALVLPGGVMNPDKLRINEKAISFIKGFVETGKPIAAICHGPWPLIEAGGIRGRTITSWPSLKSDLNNAGGHWVDQEVVVDNGLVTSRKPEDLEAFCKKMVEEFLEGKHDSAKRSMHRQADKKIDPSVHH